MQLARDTQSSDPITANKAKLLLSTLDSLRTDGVIFTKEVMTQYKSVLSDLNVPQKQHQRVCKVCV